MSGPSLQIRSVHFYWPCWFYPKREKPELRLSILSSEVHAQTDLPERKNANIFETLDDRETADMVGRYILRPFLPAFVAELTQKLEKSSLGIMGWQSYDGVLQTNEWWSR